MRERGTTRSTPAASRHLPRLDVDVRVVAEDRHPDRDQRLRALDLEVGDDQLGLVERRLLQRAGEDHVVAGGGEAGVDPAGEHQVGGDAEDPGHER